MDGILIKNGFQSGLKQPVAHAQFELIIPKTIELSALDKMLKDIFTLDVANDFGFFEGDEVNLLCQRFLLLATFMQSYCGIPVFDGGKVLETQREQVDDTKQKIVFSAYIPHTSHSVFDHRLNLYRAAVEIFHAFFFHPEEKLYQHLEKLNSELIQQIRRLNGQGDSTIPLLEQAYRLDIPFFNLTKHVYQLGWGANAQLIMRSIVEQDSSIGSGVTANKVETANMLRKAGLPAVEHLTVANEQECIQNALKLGWPVVIKPVDRERSEGVTINLKDEAALIKAYRHAKSFSNHILVEKQVEGDVHRIGLIKGQLLVVTRRYPKSVQGDGQKTVQQLIEQANQAENLKAPWLRMKPFPCDAEAIQQLNTQGLQLTSILDKGRYAALRPIPSIAEGGYVDDYFQQIHPENLKLAKQVAKLFRLESVGVDLITTDIEKPWYETGARINEVNFSPGVGNRAFPWHNAKMQRFLTVLFPEACRIPIKVLVGGEDAWSRGEQLHQEACQTEKAFLLSHYQALDFEANPKVFASDSLFQRCVALLTNQDVEAIIVVVQTDEFLQTGLPFDQIVDLQLVSNQLVSLENGQPLIKKRYKQLTNYLQEFTIKS